MRPPESNLCSFVLSGVRCGVLTDRDSNRTLLGAALSGEASVTLKTRNGPVEQMRVLLVARRSARQQRIQSLNQLRHLVFTSPEPIRVRFKDRYKTALVTEAANMRPRKGSDPVAYTTNLVIRNLARRVKRLNNEMREVDPMLTALVEQTTNDRPRHPPLWEGHLGTL